MKCFGELTRSNSHPGQSFSLSWSGPISISRANAHMHGLHWVENSTSHHPLIVNSVEI